MKSVYIHIPFCDHICSYCDFPKFYYNKNWVSSYLKELEKEINLVYQKDPIKTIYVGGGTPTSLCLEELKTLFLIIQKLDLKQCVEFTFECNIENITKEKAEFLYQNGVNRLSIGVQTFHESHLDFLNRHHKKREIKNKIKMLKAIGFQNISVDLMYALPSETIEELIEDINSFLELEIPHISTYSLMIEANTILGINQVGEMLQDVDASMYQVIIKILSEHGFIHYETSNFGKRGFESKHNLVYWNNEEYYGFGLGASGYVDHIRYDNTKNWNVYMKGNYLKEFHKLSLSEEIENELILGFRKIKGISLAHFYHKYHKNLTDYKIIQTLLKEGNLVIEHGNIKIRESYIYISNQILCQLIGEKYE